MKPLRELDSRRRLDLEMHVWGLTGFQTSSGEWSGIFTFPVHPYNELRVIASCGGGWDHLSVSLPMRTPTWGEMEAVRKYFAKPDEVWLQFGLPEKSHIDCHPHCLHWWRQLHRKVKLPPPDFV